MSNGSLDSRIRKVLGEHGRLSRDVATLKDDTDLYSAGLTSHASVSVMLGLEGEFDIEFPDEMLSRNIFSTIAAIQAALEQLTPA
ncbi:MAG: acyl carrier protein [Pseudomonadota bacterium]